jgi:hypothetical protein
MQSEAKATGLPPSACAKRFGQRRQRHLRLSLTVGTTEMGHQHDAGALARQFLDRRHQALDPRGVADTAFLHRDVQVGAQEYAAAADLESIQRPVRHGW